MEGTSATGRVPGRRALAAAALAVSLCAGCKGFTGTTASSFLMKVRSDPDPNVRFVCYQKLASSNCYESDAQKAEAVQTLVSKLKKGKEPVASRAVICRTLGEIGDPSAREALRRAVGDDEGVVRVEACRALGKVGHPDDATILARIMTVDALEDCRIAAIEGLAEMRVRDPRIFRVLVDGMDHDDPAIRWASLNALRKITGEDLGNEPGPWRKQLDAQNAAAAKPTANAATASTPAAIRR